MSETLIKKTLGIEAGASRVWAALTTPELMQQWMSYYRLEVESDWKVGSPIAFSGDLHGIEFLSKGTILRFEAQECLEYTSWSTLSQIPDIPENYSTTKFELKSLGEATELRLTQQKFPLQIIFKHWNFYWNTALQNLKDLLEG